MAMGWNQIHHLLRLARCALVPRAIDQPQNEWHFEKAYDGVTLAALLDATVELAGFFSSQEMAKLHPEPEAWVSPAGELTEVRRRSGAA
jgi:hypothetical protein